MKTISLTAYNRPDNLKQLLASLAKQNVLFHDYLLVIHIEPGNQEVIEMCREIDFVTTEIVINDQVLGIKQNTFNAISHAFSFNPDYNIYLEDDLVLSQDALNLAQWFYEQDDVEDYALLSLTNLNHGKDYCNVNRIDKPIMWGFVMTPKQFKKYAEPNWLNAAMWDYNVAYAIIDSGIQCLQPEISRCTNTGDYGTHLHGGLLEQIQKDQTFNETVQSYRYKINKDFEVDTCVEYDYTNTSMSENRDFLYDLVKVLKPKKVVELGTYYGCSYFSFAQAIKDNKLATELVGVDTWRGDEHTNFYGETVFETFAKLNARYFNQKYIRKTFEDAVNDFEDESINILLIDGLHTYEAAKKDLENYLPKLSKDGLILFHDTNVQHFSLKELWAELYVKYPSYNFQNVYGLGIIAPKGKKNYIKLIQNIIK